MEEILTNNSLNVEKVNSIIQQSDMLMDSDFVLNHEPSSFGKSLFKSFCIE